MQMDETKRHHRNRLGRRAFALLVLTPFLVLESAPAGTTEPLRGPSEPGAMELRVQDLIRDVNPSLPARSLERIGRSVMRCSDEHALDPTLVAAVIYVESRARPGALSPKGAVGLMQVMPHMYERIDLAGNMTTIESNVEAGCWILSHGIERLGEDEGVSAYFWGSNIRNASYLNRVRAAQARLQRDLAS